MPRPDYIARLHAAKYNLRFCDGEQKGEMLRIYRTALAEAAREAGASEALIEAAVARDFGDWVRQERLPKPPKSKTKEKWRNEFHAWLSTLKSQVSPLPQ